MAKEDNLKKIELTHEEAVEIGRKGGKASVKARRQRKAMREQLEMLLSMPIKNSEIKDSLKKLGIKNTDLNNQMAITIALYQRALAGDTKAYELIRDTLGEKPIEQIQNINPPVINLERPKDD